MTFAPVSKFTRHLIPSIELRTSRLLDGRVGSIATTHLTQYCRVMDLSRFNPQQKRTFVYPPYIETKGRLPYIDESDRPKLTKFFEVICENYDAYARDEEAFIPDRIGVLESRILNSCGKAIHYKKPITIFSRLQIVPSPICNVFDECAINRLCEKIFQQIPPETSFYALNRMLIHLFSLRADYLEIITESQRDTLIEILENAAMKNIENKEGLTAVKLLLILCFCPKYAKPKDILYHKIGCILFCEALQSYTTEKFEFFMISAIESFSKVLQIKEYEESKCSIDIFNHQFTQLLYASSRKMPVESSDKIDFYEHLIKNSEGDILKLEKPILLQKCLGDVIDCDRCTFQERF